MAELWNKKLAHEEFERAKEFTLNTRMDGEEVSPLILLLLDDKSMPTIKQGKGREIAAIPIPEDILSGGGTSVSNFSTFLIDEMRPAYFILLMEAWMAAYSKGEKSPRPSQHPGRVETIVILMSSPTFEKLATSPIIGGVPQKWEELEGHGGRFSEMYGISWDQS